MDKIKYLEVINLQKQYNLKFVKNSLFYYNSPYSGGLTLKVNKVTWMKYVSGEIIWYVIATNCTYYKLECCIPLNELRENKLKRIIND